MRAVDLIRQKRDGAALEADAIREFVRGVTDGTWADYQIAALLMAIYWRGMTLDEATVLTDAMMRSGARLDLRDLPGTPVDKHSTGGVGDKTSLILAPLAAACGAIVPMMSGRGLGHTGGTVDKLESIPGFRTKLTLDEVRVGLRKTGCVLISQTREIAPADARLYALRDVTGTVESVPLICGSILSKKIAQGIDGLVLDVKVGRGAFMRTLADARTLATWLVQIAERSGVRTEALLTRMDVPLGRAIGNANEIVEAIEVLKGEGPSDVEDLSVELAARMLVLGRIQPDLCAATAAVRSALQSGAGLEKFRQIIEQQGGDSRVIDDYGRLPRAPRELTWSADRAGVVADLDAEKIGRAAVVLGAGRHRAEVDVNPAVGIDILAPIGSRVAAGDPLLRLWADETTTLDDVQSLLSTAAVIAESAPAPVSQVMDVIGGPVR